MDRKNMREHTHEEFVDLVSKMDEAQLLDYSATHGGYPVLVRMALDERVSHIPLTQTGAAVILRDKTGRILLQERSDRNAWGLPGGCQDLGEDLRATAVREIREEAGIKLDPHALKLVDVLSGESRRNTYPNGDIVYNVTVLFLFDIPVGDIPALGRNDETKRLKFFNLTTLPDNLIDADLIELYKNRADKL